MFDKTGTLTEDDCDIKCILPCVDSTFTNEIKIVAQLVQKKILELMACCNSIIRIDESLSGDPIDLKLFEFTDWIYSMDEAKFYSREGPSPLSIQLTKQFPFSSQLQRMSVIGKCSNQRSNEFEFYSKGSPEIIVSLCLASSVPQNISSILKAYSSKGYRIIGMAYKHLDVDQSLINEIPREKLECEMIFLGKVFFFYLIQDLSMLAHIN